MLGESMEREIREQPSLLAKLAPQYSSRLGEIVARRGLHPVTADGRPDAIELVLLVARGSSDHAALYGRYLIEICLGIPAVLAAPSVLTRYGRRVRYPKCLAIGISQSGAAPDVSEVLDEMRSAGHATLAITNTPGTRVTEAAADTLLLDVGEEKAVAATKTYSASLLALYELVRSLGASLPLPETPNQDWQNACELAAKNDAPLLVDGQPRFALARGYSFASANETALKLMECALLSTKAYSTADFEHGPKVLAGPGSVAVAFGKTGKDLPTQGCVVVSAPEPPVAEEQAPIWHAIYAQWLALASARIVGEEPDQPQFIRKVTKTL